MVQHLHFFLGLARPSRSYGLIIFVIASDRLTPINKHLTPHATLTHTYIHIYMARDGNSNHVCSSVNTKMERGEMPRIGKKKLWIVATKTESQHYFCLIFLSPGRNLKEAGELICLLPSRSPSGTRVCILSLPRPLWDPEAVNGLGSLSLSLS